MQVYKALISDIDNTLVEVTADGSNIDSATVYAVSQALENGIHISVATGRSWASAKPVVKKLGLTAPCIVEGGGGIVDPQTEKMIWEKHIDAKTSDLVIQVFKRYAKANELVKSSGRPERVSLQSVESYDFKNRVIYLLGTNAQTAQAVKKALSSFTSIAVNLTTPSWAGSDLFDVHITSRYGTKEYALEEWHRLMGVRKADCIGMGDSANDLPLFNAVGLKVAVGNATSDLKAAADYIAPSLRDDPLKHVLEKFFTPDSNQAKTQIEDRS